MQSTNKPLPYLVPFAQNDGSRTEIPATTSDATRFSQQLGSPPLTGMPPEAGGVPPQLSDFNGAMNQLARVPWWTLLGGRFAYDADWATNSLIGGYPRGAVLPAALGTGAVGIGEWYNTSEDNTANPDTVGTGWVPGYQYGATNLTAQTGGTVVLTPAQAAKTTLRISGTLTSNLIIVVPDWVYAWSVYNTTTGAFSVSIKNAATAAVVVPQDGLMADIRSDGTSVTRVEQAIPVASQIAAGVQRNATSAEAQAFSSTTLTITPGTLGAAIPAATTTVVGRTRLATEAEAGAASSATIAVTPAGLAQTKSTAWITGLDGALASRPTTGSDARFNALTPSGGVQGFQITWNTFPGITGVNEYVNNRGTGSGGHKFYIRNTSTDTAVQIVHFDANGKIIAAGGFQDGSSWTIKDHVADLTDAECLASVLALRSVAYRYKGSEVQREGYYAEQAREAGFTCAVTESEEGSFSPLLVEDTQLLPRHTGAIHALYAMISELRERIAKLEGSP